MPEQSPAIPLGLPLPPEVSTEVALGDFVAHRAVPSPQQRGEISYQRREISSAHHDRHLEAIDFIPGSADLSPAKQDLLGATLELADTAEKGEVVMGPATSSTNHPEIQAKSAEDPAVAIVESLRMARLRAGTEYAKSNSIYGVAQQEMRQLYSDTINLDDAPNRYSEMTAMQMNQILGELRHTAEYMDALNDNYGLTMNSLGRFIGKMPTNIFQELYTSKSDAESGAFKYVLNQNIQSDDEYVKHVLFQRVAKVYNGDVLDLSLNKEKLADPVVDKLVADDWFASCAIYSMPEKPAGESQTAYDMKIRDYSEKFMRHLGIPPQISADYRRAMNKRTMRKDKDHHTIRGEGAGVDVPKLQQILQKLNQALKNIDPSTINRVWEKCGLTNFDNYTPQQIERMSDFAQGKPELLEHLRAGDVTVLFVDAKGDHNGSLGGIAETFEQESGRTLIFEIHQPKDFLRYRNMLKKFGIKASTVGVGVHGSPGRQSYGIAGPGEDGFLVTNAEQDLLDKYTAEDGITRYSVHQSKLIATLAEDIMQDSRGIDDDESLIGRRQVIMLSCSQAVARDVERSDDNKGRTVVPESTAVSIIKSIGLEKVDLLAAPAPVGELKTDRGYQLQMPEDGSIVPTIRHRLEGGRVITEEVIEVILRPSSNVNEHGQKVAA